MAWNTSSPRPSGRGPVTWGGGHVGCAFKLDWFPVETLQRGASGSQEGGSWGSGCKAVK